MGLDPGDCQPTFSKSVLRILIFLTLTPSLLSDFMVKWWCKPLGRTLQIKQLLVSSRRGEMWFLWSQAIDSDRRAWAFLKRGGLSALESRSDAKVQWRWQHHVPKTREDKCVCPAFVVLPHFFSPPHPHLFWHHSEPHAGVRPLYRGATFFRNRGELLYACHSQQRNCCLVSLMSVMPCKSMG